MTGPGHISDDGGAGTSPLCPSFPCRDGAKLLGVVQHDGSVAFTPDLGRIDQTFVAECQQGRTPEARFRFAGPCLGGRCAQWGRGRCGVADWVVETAGDRVDPMAQLPDCGVRARCRWFSQNGADACRICPLVITAPTDVRGGS